MTDAPRKPPRSFFGGDPAGDPDDADREDDSRQSYPPSDPRPLVDTICEGIDSKLAEIMSELVDAKVSARLAALAFSRNDLLEAAREIRKACDFEYGALGDCDYCGQLAEAIQRAHTGSETADYCTTEVCANDGAGCEICRLLNADTVGDDQ